MTGAGSVPRTSAGCPRPSMVRALLHSRAMTRGRFITFEGPEGGGKTVLARRLAEDLERRGHLVRSLREPGGTRLGERLRGILLEKAGPNALVIDPRADAL